MLAKRPYNVSTLLGTLSILKQPFNDSLFEFLTTITLAICHFHEAQEDTLDRERLRLPESEALSLLCLESNVSCIPMLVI